MIYIAAGILVASAIGVSTGQPRIAGYSVTVGFMVLMQIVLRTLS